MTKKSVFGALFLIGIGIVFGVLLVSNFHGGISAGFAGDPQVKLGAAAPIKDGDATRVDSRGFVAVAKAVTPTVVSINVTMKDKKNEDIQEFFHFFNSPDKKLQQQPEMGSGSGVVISPNGYILTNNHVVEDADDEHIEVVFNDNKKLKAKLVGTDPTTDLAVIKVEAKDLPTCAFGNSDKMEVGEWVLAVGNPLGLQSTVTAGIISATGRNIGIIRAENYGIENFIQTDAAINPGNSGGPLVNMNGEVIGINSAIATTNARYQGYGFAIPINLAKTVAEDIIKYGKIRRGYIGVNIQAADETTTKAMGLDRSTAVLVQNVVKDGAAAAAGLQDGDIILSVEGHDVFQPNELQTIIAQHHPGDLVALKVFRDGKTFDKSVELRAREDDKIAAKNDEDQSSDDESSAAPEKNSKSLALDNIGLSVSPLTADLKKTNEVDNGVLIDEVDPRGEAAGRGIGEGDIIISADKKDVTSPKDLKSILDKHKAGDALLLRVKRQGGPVYFTAIEIPK
jgi:serine protease Do